MATSPSTSPRSSRRACSSCAASGPDETRRILGSFAPNILFPYIRQTVSDVVVKGGFPPFLLPHVNFDALFERSLQEQASRADGQPAPEQPN